MAEELHAGGRRQVLLVEARRLDELHFGPKRIVEFVRPERSGMQRAGDEFPERIQLLELRLVGIVKMRGAVMYVRRQPYGVGEARRLDDPRHAGDFQLASPRRSLAL